MGHNLESPERALSKYLYVYKRLKNRSEIAIEKHLIPLFGNLGSLFSEDTRISLAEDGVLSAGWISDVKREGLSIKFLMVGTRCEIAFILLPSKGEGCLEWYYYKYNERSQLNDRITVFQHKFDESGNLTISETGETTALGASLRLYLISYLPQLVELIDNSR